MVAAIQIDFGYVPPEPAVAPEMRQIVNRLRFHAKTCRAKAHVDFFRACSLLDPTSKHSEDAHCQMLLRVMGQAIESEPVFFRPGEEKLSFDERWLVATLSAWQRQDHDSFEFLIRCRVSWAKRRIFGALISGLANFPTKRV